MDVVHSLWSYANSNEHGEMVITIKDKDDGFIRI